jgi:hypothetical protein
LGWRWMFWWTRKWRVEKWKPELNLFQLLVVFILEIEAHNVNHHLQINELTMEERVIVMESKKNDEKKFVPL